MNQIVLIKGMACGGCVKSVEKALSTIEGVQEVSVTLNAPQAHLQAAQTVTDQQINKALSAAGDYRVATTEDNEPKKSAGSCCG